MKPCPSLFLQMAVLLLVLYGPCSAQPKATPLPPLQAAQTEAVDIVANSGFEDAQSKAWRFSDWPPREGTSDRLIAESVLYSDNVVHSGKGALCLDLTTVGEDRILLAQQQLSVDRLAPHDGKRLRMSAWAWLARGPGGYQGVLTLRQWGEPGTPPLSHQTLRVPAIPGEWTQCATEFTLRVGNTRKADIGVGMRQVPDLDASPIVYVDDVRLEVLEQPELSGNLLRGRTVLQPDPAIPVKVLVSDSAWEDGQRRLRWDITSADGSGSYAFGNVALPAPVSVLEAPIPELPEGDYALRLALGPSAGARTHELLLPFRKAEGPYVR